jgi:glycosyltransferase involved in cell wall biosynthesis
MNTKHLVLLGMFDLTTLESARGVRIHNLHLALQKQAPIRLIVGQRTARRKAIIKFLREGGLQKSSAIYVEASTSTATEFDLLLLRLAKQKRIPILIYIPDAYQLFPILYPRKGLKVKLLDWGWRISIANYQRLADQLLFPTQALADCFNNIPPVSLLPPAGLSGRELHPINWHQPKIVYIGAASYRYGSDLFLTALEQVVAKLPNVEAHFITNNDQYLAEHPSRNATWLKVESKTFYELPQVMQDATIAVIPLRPNPYNDLALPVKLFDYMSFGRPTISTNCKETARFILNEACGQVVEGHEDALANGLIQLLQNHDHATELGKKAYESIQMAHAWEHRADQIWQLASQLHL